MSRSRRAGFTLIEILVAMTVAAVVLLGADVVYEQLAAGSHAFAIAARAEDTSRNADLLVRQLVREVDVSPRDAGVPARTFGGDSLSAHFTSWCTRPGGWKAGCEVLLKVVRDTPAAGAVAAITSTGDTARIRTRAPAVALRYLLDARNGGTWLVSWGQGPNVPQAIGIIAGEDTTVLRVGGRG